MTSEKLTLSDVRILLDRYYDGSTTPAEEDALTSYFLTHADVPADMAVDRQIFTAIARAAAVAPPADLEARIVAATCGKSRRPGVLWRWAGAAASVAVAVVVGAVLFIGAPETSDPVAEAEESIFTAFVNHPDTILRVEEKAKPEPVTMAAASTSAPPARRRHKTASRRAQCIEITDSAQMAEAMRFVDRELAECFACVGNGVRDTRETFTSIDKTINKISR